MKTRKSRQRQKGGGKLWRWRKKGALHVAFEFEANFYHLGNASRTLLMRFNEMILYRYVLAWVKKSVSS